MHIYMYISDEDGRVEFLNVHNNHIYIDVLKLQGIWRLQGSWGAPLVYFLKRKSSSSLCEKKSEKSSASSTSPPLTQSHS